MRPIRPDRGGGQDRGDYLTALKPDALAGKRFGVLRQAMGYHPDVDAAMEKALPSITQAGATVVDVKIPTYNRGTRPRSRCCSTSSRTA